MGSVPPSLPGNGPHNDDDDEEEEQEEIQQVMVEVIRRSTKVDLVSPPTAHR